MASQPLKRTKIAKTCYVNKESPGPPATPSAPSSSAKPSSPNEPKINMPYPCPPHYQLPTATQEVRQVPVAKADTPSIEPPAAERVFPLGPSGTRERGLKRPKTPPVPRRDSPPPNDEQSYPSTLRASPSQQAGQPRPTRPVPRSNEQVAKSGVSTPTSMSTTTAEALRPPPPPPLPAAKGASEATESSFRLRPVPVHLGLWYRPLRQYHHHQFLRPNKL